MSGSIDRCDAGLTRAEQRRHKLVETARSLFIQNGFHATGIAQIATESGIAVGQIYRDFSSKEEIVAALVRTDCERIMTVGILDAAIRARDADSVRAWLRDFIVPSQRREDDRLFAEILAESSRNQRIGTILGALQADLRVNILAALALLAPGDAIAGRREAMADIIMTISLGLLHHRLMTADLDVDSVTDALHAIVEKEIDTLAR